jgi:hypothetical protein
MKEYMEIAMDLRNLIRKTESPFEGIPAIELLALSEKYERKFEEIEMGMIIQTQRDAIENE